MTGPDTHLHMWIAMCVTKKRPQNEIIYRSRVKAHEIAKYAIFYKYALAGYL